MGLRHRTSLKRCQNTEGEQPVEKSSPQKSKKHSSRSNITLVTPDTRLNQFLNPVQEFDTQLLPEHHKNRAVAAPSRVASAVSNLGKLESEVIVALFPPNGSPPASMEEIAKDLGMTVEEVQNIADEALRGLRGLRTGPQRVSKAWN